MAVDVLIGLQWGDEGKGKIVDAIANDYDVIARFQGGPNAGHTLNFGGKNHVLHTIPSGIFRENTINIIGNGVVLNPIGFQKEIENLETLSIKVNKNLFISKKAHLILPTHLMLDKASEESKGKQKIGSTLRGIGPTYMDKTGRNGLRIGDILSPQFREQYEQLKRKHEHILATYEIEYDITELETAWFEGIEKLKKLNIVDGEYFINELIRQGKRILAEGAQGSLLDIDFGTYPFVTSSNTITAAVCTGLGVAPKHIGEVIGIVKAYCTRVGSGPFPTELEDQTGQTLRKEGNEYGATTGRDRRCGWLDIPALKYTCMINGVSQLALTKIDVLNIFEEIEICTHYEYDGEVTDQFPFNIKGVDITPHYKSMQGWKCHIKDVSKFDELPRKVQDYISFIQDKVNVKVTLLSTGPERDKMIRL